MIQDASQQVYVDPWLMVPTGVVLALTVVAANELADAIAHKGPREKDPGPQEPDIVDHPAGERAIAAQPGAVLGRPRADHHRR